MADHATTGGYAVAGTVITADLPLAGQLAPGDWIEFEACSLETANAALRRREAALDARSGAFQEQMAARFGAERVRADVPLAPLHDIQGRRTRRMASRDQDVGRNRRGAAHRARERRRGDAARRRIERADRRPRRARAGHQAPRRQIEQVDAERVRADAATTINGLVRWTIHRGIAGLEAWAARPEPWAARFSATRTSAAG